MECSVPDLCAHMSYLLFAAVPSFSLSWHPASWGFKIYILKVDCIEKCSTKKCLRLRVQPSPLPPATNRNALTQMQWNRLQEVLLPLEPDLEWVAWTACSQKAPLLPAPMTSETSLEVSWRSRDWVVSPPPIPCKILGIMHDVEKVSSVNPITLEKEATWQHFSVVESEQPKGNGI